MFEALVELSPKRSVAGSETQDAESKAYNLKVTRRNWLVVMRLKLQKQSALNFLVELSNSQSLLEIIPRMRDCGTNISKTVDVISKENLPGQYS
jgi:hypothetical protein